MATVLFTWELGGGLGHILPMKPLAEGLVAAGHRVFVALRNLSAAGPVLGQSGVLFLQAPFAPGQVYFPRTLSVAHILANVGWRSYAELYGPACGWRSLFQLVKPDLIVFDHSPTAMLASQGIPGVRRAVIGNGFFCPPDLEPFPLFRASDTSDPARSAPHIEALLELERGMLGGVNQLLEQWGQQPLPRLAALYSRVDETLLATFPELDHYGERPGVRYWGTVSGARGGKPLRWPAGSGRRVFAYLRQCAALPHVLAALRDRGDNAVVYADGVTPTQLRPFESDRMRFEGERLDLAQVVRECDAAVHHGNHGTISQLLLGGRPMLSVPIHLEQKLTARTIQRLGAGHWTDAQLDGAMGSGKTEDVARKLDALLVDKRHAAAAEAFARRYQEFDSRRQEQQIVDRLQALIPARRGLVPSPQGSHSFKPAASADGVFCG